ncbi:hypothetical protein Fmac_026783 [Flemingia macrophylla]|uniref:AP2/ERF domain-containing protein n=1 Tax=Flemingia macrophylla TaxID=520843 RepID=A0ABD1LFU9_9FABA
MPTTGEGRQRRKRKITGLNLGQPQQHRLLRRGSTPAQGITNQIRFIAVNTRPWEGFAGEIRAHLNNRHAWRSTLHTAEEASAAYDAAPPTMPPRQRRRRA